MSMEYPIVEHPVAGSFVEAFTTTGVISLSMNVVPRLIGGSIFSLIAAGVNAPAFYFDYINKHLMY